MNKITLTAKLSLLAFGISMGSNSQAQANGVKLPEKNPHGRQVVQITHIQRASGGTPTVVVTTPVRQAKTHANWKSWEKNNSSISPPTLAPVHYKTNYASAAPATTQKTQTATRANVNQQAPVSVRAQNPMPPRSTEVAAQKTHTVGKLPEKRRFVQARQENPQIGSQKKTQQVAYERLDTAPRQQPVQNGTNGGAVAQRVAYNNQGQQQNTTTHYTGNYTEYTPQYKSTTSHTVPREITLSEYQAMQNRVLPKAQKLKQKPTPHTHTYDDGSKGGYLYMPVKYSRVSSKYGMRVHPTKKVIEMHTGVDFAAPKHTPIHAAQGGIVTFAGWRGGYGNTVIVRHNNEFATLYGHAENVLVSVNQVVQAGQVIATVGSTGRSTGNHLHFEVLRHNQHLNPRNFLVF